MLKSLFVKIKEKKRFLNNRQFCSLIIKTLLRKVFGINWKVDYLMSKDLSVEMELPQRDDILVKEIFLSDFEDPDWVSFMSSNKKLFYKKLKSIAKFNTYGAFVNGKLAYTTTIAWDKVLLSDNLVFNNYGPCGFLIDSYCHPNYRGRGIHNYMNQWCLHKIASLGWKKAYVFIYEYNIPALLTQKKCGLKIEKTFRVVFWKRHVWVKIH